MGSVTIKRRFFSDRLVEAVQVQFNAVFVVETTVKGRDGGWANLPCALFYTEKVHPVSNSHYFVVFKNHQDSLMIADGQSAVDEPIIGLKLPTGEIITSVYRHDYNQVGEYTIDGGRDYFRYTPGLDACPVQLTVVGMTLQVKPTEESA